MAVVAVSPIGGSGQQFFDNNGVMLSGGLLYTYAAGTTTPLASYTDNTGATPNANPIVLDAAGRVSGGTWLVSGSLYKLVLKTSIGATLGTWDNVAAYGATTAQAAAIAASTALSTAIANTTAAATNASGSQSIGLVATKLAMSTKVYDLGTNYDIALYRFTAPAAGMYMVTAVGNMSKGTPVIGEQVQLMIYKNGSEVFRGASSPITAVAGTPIVTPSISHLVKLAATDYIELWGIGTGAAGVWTFNPATNANQFSITRIS